ncbi:hypothetical protein EVAR_611_1 [Eumeta japonica]|uniref:Uncharacterized protein n=1 Tax=Eumeta variegata TaxID=151549 RepID=A0A4C1SE07_EUMVA|nr:hypothetical protein EVAR_611_1 [Eumeta japonica]
MTSALKLAHPVHPRVARRGRRQSVSSKSAIGSHVHARLTTRRANLECILEFVNDLYYQCDDNIKDRLLNMLSDAQSEWFNLTKLKFVSQFAHHQGQTQYLQNWTEGNTLKSATH